MTGGVPTWFIVLIIVGLCGGLLYAGQLVLDALLFLVREAAAGVRWLLAHWPRPVADD